jgi:hypothetical protein
VVGLGFAGVPEVAALDEIEQAFAGRSVPTQIELAHLADPEIGELLTARGYRLEAFENVLGLAPGLERAAPAGIEVRSSGELELDSWIDVIVDAVAHPDPQGLPWHEEFPREILENAERDSASAGLARYAALRDGVLAGGASLRIDEGVARRRRDGPGAPPAGDSERAARGPPGGCRGRRLRRRRDHDATRIAIASERAAPGLRPALHGCRAGQAP